MGTSSRFRNKFGRRIALLLIILMSLLPVVDVLAATASEIHTDEGSTGPNWATALSGTSATLYGVASGSNQIVSVGAQGTILVSPNGQSWSQTASGVSTSLFAVTYGSGLFVAVGDAGTIIRSSDGGTSWQKSDVDSAALLQDVTYGNGRYVAVGGNGAILTSTDAVKWHAHAAPHGLQLYSVVFGNGKFVAVGDSGIITTSENGDSWSLGSSGVKVTLTGVSFGNGMYIAVGAEDTVLVSTDGSSWSARPPDPENYLGLWAAAYGGGRFVGVGSLGTIAHTNDGTTWVLSENDQLAFLQDVVYVNGQFVAVGESGTIQASSLPIIPNGQDGSPPIQIPDPPTPPVNPAKGCEPGVVNGPPVERVAGALNVRADGVKVLANGEEELCGTISLTEYVKVDGLVRVTKGNPKLEGEGRVYIQVRWPVSFSLIIFEGVFDVDGQAKKVAPHGDLNYFMFSGLPIFIEEMELTEKGMAITTGTVGLPVDLMALGSFVHYLENRGKPGAANAPEEPPNYKLPIEKISVSDGYPGGKISFNDLGEKIQVGQLKVNKVEIEIEPSKGTFEIGGEFDAGILEMEAIIGLEGYRVDKFGLGVNTKIALGSSGFFVVRLYGEVSGIQTGNYKIVAEGDIGGGIPLGETEWLINATNLRVEIEWKGSLLDTSITGSGKLAIWKIPLAEAKLRIDRNGLDLTGSINALDILIVSGQLKATGDTFYGHMEGQLQIPRGSPLFPGKKLGSAEATIDKEGVRGSGEVLWVRYGCRVSWSLVTDCGRNVAILSSVAYHPVLLASTTPPPLPKYLSFELPADMKQAVIQLSWDEGAPDTHFVLIAPDGTRYTSDISPSDESFYVQEPDLNYAFYALNAPQSGTWRYEVINPDIQAANLIVVKMEPSPTITVTAPGSHQAATGPVTINWTTDAPAGSTVSLFYDTTGKGYHGTRIAKELRSDTGSYAWDPTSLPDGTYYVYAAVDDHINAPVYAYGTGKITVRNPHTPAVPSGLKAVSANGTVELSWTAVELSDLAGYFVYLLDDKQERFFVEGATSFSWSGLTPGRAYKFGVSAVSLQDLESPLSSPVSMTLVTPKPPTISVNWPVGRMLNTKTLRLSGQVSADGTATLTHNGSRIAADITGSFDRMLTLRPGINDLTVVAVSANGDSVQQTRVYIFEDVPPELRVNNLSSGAEVSQTNYTVTGTVEPGATLTANGRPVTVQADGNYRAVLTLQPGVNEVDIVARDLAGNEKAFQASVRLSASAKCGGVFPDVTAEHPACSAVEMLAAKNVLGGYPDRSFRPDRGVSRAEFSKMLVTALEWAPQPNGPLPFKDARSHWAATSGFLQAAVAMKAIGGFPDGTFKPDDFVTRAQVVRIAAAAAGLMPTGTPSYSDVKSTDWFAGWVAVAGREGLIGSSSPNRLWAGIEFKGESVATRAEAAMLLAHLLNQR